MATVSYALDLTGIAAANLVNAEPHTLTEANFRDYRFIIPKFAPFYADGIKVVHKLNNVVTELTEGVEYYLALPYMGATRSIGKAVYGGITFNTLSYDGEIYVTYQTLGGEWVADAGYVLEVLADKVYNPRVTVWDVLTNVQTTFPPVVHDQSADYVYGQKELIAAILSITGAMTGDTKLGAIKHLLNTQNPHKTSKEQVDLGLVENYGVASPEAVTAGSRYDLYVTPYALAAALFPVLEDMISRIKRVESALGITATGVSTTFGSTTVPPA